MAAALCFESRKFALSGVPANHFAIHEKGRYFFVQRGGGEIDQRPQVAVTEEQFDAWTTNGKIATLLAFGGAASGLSAAAIYLHAVWRRQSLPAE